ncbi:MAG: hypothetical protein Q9214_001012 [Letrouitia sp. 1 TL-2023]
MASSRAQSTGTKPGKNMLWGGRFTGGLDPLMVEFNESLSLDRAFYAQDIAGSLAFARANKNQGILAAKEFNAIESGLNNVLKEWKDNTFEVKPDVDEDIHTANERRLGEIIGTSIAGKLHTGRSRNEQIATDLRLWLLDELRKLGSYIAELLREIVSRAENDIELIMPGYTHLQRAQPIRWSHWLLSYGFSFADDLQRLQEVIRRVNRSPLGCGALSGNVFSIDREAMAKELGFEGILHNSMNAVSDRDFLIETMQWAAMMMGHVSRISEDLCIYSSQEFGFVKLADAYSTGSSLMPQKKNPDSLELLRGKSGRVFKEMAGFMYTLKGLPSCYNKDMQEGTSSILDTVDTTTKSIRILTGVLITLTTFPSKMREALEPSMLATELADYLVRKGVPFRETHHISGQVVALAEKEGRGMNELGLEQLREVDRRFDADVQECFDYEAAIERRKTQGGTSKGNIFYQIEVLKGMLESEKGEMKAW